MEYRKQTRTERIEQKKGKEKKNREKKKNTNERKKTEKKKNRIKRRKVEKTVIRTKERSHKGKKNGPENVLSHIHTNVWLILNLSSKKNTTSLHAMQLDSLVVATISPVSFSEHIVST